MSSIFSTPETFAGADGNHYTIGPYIRTPENIEKHLSILNTPSSSHIEYVASNKLDKGSLLDWLDRAKESDGVELLGLYRCQNKELIGTSKISISTSTSSFGAGILLDSNYVTSANLGRCVKGYIMSKCFLNLNLSTCKGICSAANLSSISIYRYFGFMARREDNSRLSFSLDKNSYLAKVRFILGKYLTESGFSLAGLQDDEVLSSDLSEIPGYSSLSFFNFISILLDAGGSKDVLDFYNCTTLSEMASLMGPSLFTL